MNIKKKLLALSAVLAIFASFAGCSDNGASESSTADNGNSSSVAENNNNADGNADNKADNNAGNNNDGDNNDDKDNAVNADVKNETLSSEEYDAITKHNLEIKPYTPAGNEVVQDAVESDNSNNAAAGDANNSQADAGSNNAQSANNDSNNAQAEGNNNNAQAGNNTPVADNDLGNNNADLPGDTKLEVHNGTRTIMQAWWMDISKGQDYIFNGEYLTAEFKIKEGTADGIYPVTLDWLDFGNWDSQTVNFTGIDGAVVVGAEATENKFNDDGTPQVMVQNVSGKAGDTVKVSIYIENNPGVVANLLRFSYNSDVLEYVGGGEGANFDGEFK